MTASSYALSQLFEKLGIEAIYGGQKGHGFWLRRNSWPVCNDGARSGNPNFWMYTDAKMLAQDLIHLPQ